MSSKIIVISNTHNHYSGENYIPIDINFLKLTDNSLTKLQLIRCNLDFHYKCIAESNNYLKITHNAIDYEINLTEEVFYDDNDFMTRLKDDINAVIPGNLFDVTKIDYTMPLNTITRENLYHFCTYTIKTTDASTFTLDMSNKNSIGPIIGFNKDKDYSGTDTYTGTYTIPIERYNTIYIHNKANYATPTYDQSTDANCKMMLYDSTGTLIQNLVDNNDSTISLKYNNPTDGPILYKNVYDYLKLIEDALNEHSASFTPTANFKVSFNYETYKVTIENTTGALFGIGFNLYNDTNQTNNYGSMHAELGFPQKTFLGITKITSFMRCQILDYIYPNEYIFLCSVDHFYDIASNNLTNFESRSYSVSSGDNIIDKYIIYPLPLSYLNNDILHQFKKEYTITVDQKIIIENNLNTVDFYIRLRSGRHARICIWDMVFSIDYD